jgi:hypothetical protein
MLSRARSLSCQDARIAAFLQQKQQHLERDERLVQRVRQDSDELRQLQEKLNMAEVRRLKAPPAPSAAIASRCGCDTEGRQLPRMRGELSLAARASRCKRRLPPHRHIRRWSAQGAWWEGSSTSRLMGVSWSEQNNETLGADGSGRFSLPPPGRR